MVRPLIQVIRIPQKVSEKNVTNVLKKKGKKTILINRLKDFPFPKTSDTVEDWIGQ